MRTFRLGALFVAIFLPNSVFAGSDSYDASTMWGTAPGGATVEGALESAAMHVQNGVVAGQVNAAKEGRLYATGSGETLNIYSIGSQSVISNNIIGNDNVVDVDAEQSATNSGDVNNDGQINTGKYATNNN